MKGVKITHVVTKSAICLHNKQVLLARLGGSLDIICCQGILGLVGYYL